MTVCVIDAGSAIVAADRLRDLRPYERAYEVEEARHEDGGARRQDVRRDDRRDRVRRVVEAVYVVEDEREPDDEHEEEKALTHRSPVLHDDGAHEVHDVLGRVDRALEGVEDLLLPD